MTFAGLRMKIVGVRYLTYSQRESSKGSQAGSGVNLMKASSENKASSKSFLHVSCLPLDERRENV